MIATLHLRNFKCFERESVSFSGLTLLSGLNGMGKSSVIQALLLLKQSFVNGQPAANGLLLNGDLVRLGTARDVLFSEADEETIGLEVIDTKSASVRIECQYDREADVLRFASPPPPDAFVGSSLFSDKCQYLQAERLGPRNFYQTSDHMVRQRGHIGTRGEFAAHFVETFYDRPISSPALAHPTVKSQALKDQLEAWLSEVSPGVRISLSKHRGMDIIQMGMSFLGGGDVSNEFRPTNVGFGLTYVLPVLLGLLASSPESLLLMENPEAHLHPRAQFKVGELVARAVAGGAQVVVETHSDHLLNGIRVAVSTGLIGPDAAAIHFFERASGSGAGRVRVVSPKLDPSGRLDRWPDGFFDQWEKGLDLLLAPAERLP